MISKKFLKKLNQTYLDYRRKRGEIGGQSMEVLSLSKQAIFALHRNEIKNASHLVDEAEKILGKLSKLIKDNHKLRYEGSLRAALEEYVEAKVYLMYIKSKKIDFIKGFDFGDEDYIGGLCDLTGELVRKAIDLATKKEYKQIDDIKDLVEEIVGELIKFNLTNYLRQKFDDAKRNLKKIEEIRYQVKLN